MATFTAFDGAQMARALRLAAQGRYSAHPNPMVGCVLVRDGEIVGEGYHAVTGGPHAEINALAAAGDARGTTAYVTLEPCAHHGRTPPCTDALIEAGVTEVIFAMEDPDSSVDGSGGERLAAAGVGVRSGLMRRQAEALNRGFSSRVQRGRPFVRLKAAASLDGATAMRSGESQWITGEAARADVQRPRAESSAGLTGNGTVLTDDPSLNVRHPALDTEDLQPIRAVFDSSLRTPPSSKLLTLPGVAVLYCQDDTRRADLEATGADVVVSQSGDGRVDIAGALSDLAGRGANLALVEAGPALSGSFLAGGFVDELVIYQAPHIMGSETRRMFDTPGWLELDERVVLDIVDVRRIGGDLRITARPQQEV